MIRTLCCLLFCNILNGADLDKCVHLLNRTSFGSDYKQLKLCLDSKSYSTYVKIMLNPKVEVLVNHIPKGSDSLFLPPSPQIKNYVRKRREFSRKLSTFQNNLRAWWLSKVVYTDEPFLERMVLFWHSHFTTSFNKVAQPKLIYSQNLLFRKHALGNFSTLLHEIIENPAMLNYLDNSYNKKNHPNENFARELLELFTLGQGQYTEMDIKYLAKSLTGYSVDKHRNFLFKKHLHDYSAKTLFGKIGKFDGHQAIDIILKQQETAEFIVRKLWIEFIGETLNKNEIKRLSTLFKNNNYELKPLLYALFTSPYFLDTKTRGKMVKSPIELIVGVLRTFEYHTFDRQISLKYLKLLGQNIFTPPNVKGWKGGIKWINSNTLLLRKVFLNRLMRDDMMKHFDYRLFSLAPKNISKEEFACKVLLPLTVCISPKDTFDDTLRIILRNPLYQLK